MTMINGCEILDCFVAWKRSFVSHTLSSGGTAMLLLLLLPAVRPNRIVSCAAHEDHYDCPRRVVWYDIK